METIKTGEMKIPLKTWCSLDELEEGALQQAKNACSLPMAFHHMFLAPDAHQGYGMPIGGVIALENAISPNLCGVDIGCGMGWIMFDIDAKVITKELLEEVAHSFRRSVPVGFNHHKEPQLWKKFDLIDIGITPQIIIQELGSARKQLGTLGGGNHFIELQEADNGKLCLMLHSGSRNIGLKIANHYNKIAQHLCKIWYSSIPEMKGDDGLAFLPFETNEAKEYFFAMNFALEFAKENRKQMMEACKKDLTYTLKKNLNIEPKVVEEVNIHHNFAAWENHFGKNVIVHRKGATQAKKGQMGIIPGSMGTSSYIVKGLGNPESFESCSHGAGRAMSRTRADKELTLEMVKEVMESIVWEPSKREGRRDRRREINEYDLSEAPQAYKDIGQVIEAQKDLVEVVYKLKPLAVVKG